MRYADTYNTAAIAREYAEAVKIVANTLSDLEATCGVDDLNTTQMATTIMARLAAAKFTLTRDQ